jgi:hypothetical protein
MWAIDRRAGDAVEGMTGVHWPIAPQVILHFNLFIFNFNGLINLNLRLLKLNFKDQPAKI